MATSKVAQWTIIITVEEDETLTGSYRMPPSTRLADLMETWMDDFELFGHWIFKSADEEVTYHDDRKTLEAIGETFPRMIYLRAELSDEPIPRPTTEIFVYSNETCHRVLVNPHEKLYRVVWQLPGKPKRFEYNGFPLNLMDTVKQAGLRHQSIIYESLCSVSVKLSSGETAAVKLPSDSLVLNLKEKVSFYESNDFVLRYQGRYLRSEESIAQLKDAVYVSSAEFVVNVDGRLVRWTTQDAQISVSEFICQLALHAEIDTKKLESLQFVCVGCQRHIQNSENDPQQLPVECCQRRSLTLNAVEASDSGSTSEANDVTRLIRSLHKQLDENSRESRTAASRRFFREMSGKLGEEGLDYNVLTQCSCTLLTRIKKLEAKIQEQEAVLETLKMKTLEMGKEIEEFKVRNVKSRVEIEELKERSRKLCDEMDEQLGVKLLVAYDHNVFTPTSRPEVQSREQWPWNDSLSFIKCRVRGIRPGSEPWEEVVAVLQPLFEGRQGRKIAGIGQQRGIVAGREVAQVTSLDKDEVAKFVKDAPFCAADGAQHSWEEAGKPQWQFCEGGRVVICGGQRRTVLSI